MIDYDELCFSREVYELIVLGSEGAHTEIGVWGDNPYEKAILFIQKYFLSS